MGTTTKYLDTLNAQTVQASYARMAAYYDYVFGPLLAPARSAAIRVANQLPGRDVLEVGVGTGLALPKYGKNKRITGIDVSQEMLIKAQARVDKLRIPNVRTLLEMDAESTNFADGQFDIAIAMFVASVVPNPLALLAEMRRVVKPSGMMLFVNHFAAEQGVPQWWRRGSEAVSTKLGWRADFRLRDIFTASDLEHASMFR